jgi:hypothetical protein
MIRNSFIVLCIVAFTITILPGFQCRKDYEDTRLSGCIKGRLVVKGPCAQYVIQVISGDAGNADIAANWLDPETNINYTNVFTVKNYCYFPALNPGDEFNFFFIKQVKTMDCIVCMAVRATPSEGNEVQYMGSTCP